MENYFDIQLDKKQVDAITNLGLAHMGDGIYELLVRTHLCCRGDKTVKKLHKETVELVNAASQAAFAEKLLPHLTEEERSAFTRGRNAKPHSTPKHCSLREYALATGLECLFGTLYLKGETQRVLELWQMALEVLA